MIITPCVIFLARKTKSVNESPHKIDSRVIARFGGVAIVLSAAIALSAAYLFWGTFGAEKHGLKIAAVLCGSLLIFLVGLLDDIYSIRAEAKFFGEFCAAIIVCSFGVRIESLVIPQLFTIEFGLIGSWIITILWLVGITNAVNFSDGLDGLAAGISAIGCAVIAATSIYLGLGAAAAITFAVLGSVSGFLFYNSHPAKIFMGDCGSLFLGFILASMSTFSAAEKHNFATFAIVAIVLGIPIFDTLFSMLRRFLERRSMFSADQGHFHHRLLKMQLNRKHTVLATYALTIIFTVLGLFLFVAKGISSLVIFAGIMVLIVLVFCIAGSVKIEKVTRGLKKRLSIKRQIKEETRNFENLQLSFRRAVNFDQWWSAVRLAAEKMSFVSIKLIVSRRNGNKKTFEWSNSVLKTDSPQIETTVPINDRRSDQLMTLNVITDKGNSLESAARRISLLCRLIEENGLSEL